jgi:hypothetical protein
MRRIPARFLGLSLRAMMALAIREKGHAADRYSDHHRVRRICDRELQFGGSGLAKNSHRANLDRYQLYDGLQFTGGEPPNHLLGSWNAADQRRHGDRQRQPEHVVSAQLHDPAGQLSDDLRIDVPLAVMPIR